MHLATFTLAELVRHAQVEISDLTSTPLEIELLKRLEQLQSRQAELDVLDEYESEGPEFLKRALELHLDYSHVDARALLSALSDADIDDPKHLRGLLETISDAGIDDVESLKARLSRADEFDAIAKDAGDLFARLNTLVTKE